MPESPLRNPPCLFTAGHSTFLITQHHRKRRDEEFSSDLGLGQGTDGRQHGLAAGVAAATLSSDPWHVAARFGERDISSKGGRTSA